MRKEEKKKRGLRTLAREHLSAADALKHGENSPQRGQTEALIGIGYVLLELVASVDQLRFELDTFTEMLAREEVE